MIPKRFVLIGLWEKHLIFRDPALTHISDSVYVDYNMRYQYYKTGMNPTFGYLHPLELPGLNLEAYFKGYLVVDSIQCHDDGWY